MAVAAYFHWESSGRPWHPASPVGQFASRLKEIYPLAAGFIWMLGDSTHLTSDFPQDHTPFSATGWPAISPYPVVFAVDVSNQPSLGTNTDVLFPYWLSEAKAGRMPWVKYFIYKAKRYDVRNGWSPVSAVGHESHVHVSGRTDYENYQLGDWSPAPLSDPPEEEDVRLETTLFRFDDGKGHPYWRSIGCISRMRLDSDADVDFMRARSNVVLFPGEDPQAPGFPWPNLAEDPDWNPGLDQENPSYDRLNMAFGPDEQLPVAEEPPVLPE